MAEYSENAHERRDEPVKPGEIEFRPGTLAAAPGRVCAKSACAKLRQANDEAKLLAADIQAKQSALAAKLAAAAAVQQHHDDLVSRRDDFQAEIKAAEAKISECESRIAAIPAECARVWRTNGSRDHFIEFSDRKFLKEVLESDLPNLKAELGRVENELAALEQEHF